MPIVEPTNRPAAGVFTPATLQAPAVVRDAVNDFLAGFYDRKLAEARVLDKSYARLWHAMSELALAGGKRLRPYMTVLAYKAFGGADDQAIVPIAAAYELLHTCMLIHDDIIDRDYVRYGVDNVAGTYRKLYAAAGLSDDEGRHYAASAALMAGDLLLSAAYQVVAEAPLPPEAKLTAMRSLQQSVFLVAGGELLDSESAFTPQDTESARTIARLKTASYSFEGPLTCGAALAGASSRQLGGLHAAAEQLGIAFQMYDDVLGIFGNDAATGKSTISDLAEGKRTVLLQQTLTQSSEAVRTAIQQVIGKGHIGPADAAMVRAAMESSGARSFIEGYAAEHVERARHLLQGLGYDAAYAACFERLLSSVTPESA